jgi:hypothetical protein
LSRQDRKGYDHIKSNTGDHRVDWADFSLFALDWLDAGDRLDADFSRNGIVDFDDLTRCAKYWLEGITP